MSLTTAWISHVRQRDAQRLSHVFGLRCRPIASVAAGTQISRDGILASGLTTYDGQNRFPSAATYCQLVCALTISRDELVPELRIAHQVRSRILKGLRRGRSITSRRI